MSVLQAASFILYGVAGLLILEALVFRFPGTQWNGPRRILFGLLYFLLVWSDRSLFGYKWRGLLLALILMGIGYGLGHVLPGSTIQATP